MRGDDPKHWIKQVAFNQYTLYKGGRKEKQSKWTDLQIWMEAPPMLTLVPAYLLDDYHEPLVLYTLFK